PGGGPRGRAAHPQARRHALPDHAGLLRGGAPQGLVPPRPLRARGVGQAGTARFVPGERPAAPTRAEPARAAATAAVLTAVRPLPAAAGGYAGLLPAKKPFQQCL